MQNSVGALGRKIALKGVVVQLFVSFLLIVIVSFLHYSKTIDVILGCIAFLVPHSIFAYWVFRYSGATKNNLVAQSFSQGMKIKLFLTSIIFVVAFAYFSVHPIAFLGAYVTTMLSQWLAMGVVSS